MIRNTFSFKTLAVATLLAAASVGAFAQTDALAKAAAEKGATVTASGLVFRSLKEGSGSAPAATDTVRVHYKGLFTSGKDAGKEFDSSYSRNEPTSFPLNRVIKCWTEGLQLMKPGGKAVLTCPAAIAYGERGTPGGPIPPNSVLKFEVELLAISPR